MAKIKKSIQTFSGKMGEVVYVDNRSHGSYVRRAVKAGTKKDEPALKQQYSRTAFLNSVASDVNNVVKKYAGILKPNRFYQDVQQLIRKESDNNRYLLLQQLKGMEVNKAYPLGRIGTFNCRTRYGRSRFTVELVTTRKPIPGKLDANCYCFSVILLLWEKGAGKSQDSLQISEWVAMPDGAPVFEFIFKRPVRALHWLLCVHLQLGKNEQNIDTLQGEGMQIIDAGSFDKTDVELLRQRPEKEVTQERKEVEVQLRIKRKS